MTTSVLSMFESLQFSVLACPLDIAAAAIRDQGKLWGKVYSIDRGCPRDIRQIYWSKNGPAKMPAVITGMMLGHVDGHLGPRTLFLSNVRDGYNSMVACLSKRIPDDHLSVQVSRADVQFPIAQFKFWRDFEVIRVVRVMREDHGWDFFERGMPAAFENASHYLARRKRDRLNAEIIAQYLQRFGYGSLDREYWIDADETAHLLCEADFGVAQI